MSDNEVRTCFDTEAGRLGFQEYYVRERLAPRLRSLELQGEASPERVAEEYGALTGCRR